MCSLYRCWNFFRVMREAVSRSFRSISMMELVIAILILGIFLSASGPRLFGRPREHAPVLGEERTTEAVRLQQLPDRYPVTSIE